jgi:hypothetical protein
MIKVKRIREECLSCNDLLPRVKELPEKNEEDALPPGDIAKIQDMLLMHCYPCALEKAGIHARAGQPGTFNKGTGGGRRVIRDNKTH